MSKSIVTDLEKGVYLLKDAIPCSGRVTSIELCGGIVNSGPSANFTRRRVYLNAALYRLHQTDQINSLERITAVEHLVSRSSATIELDNGLTCARLSIAGRNWTALEGDMLGVSFINTSCEAQKYGSVTVQTCPVYLAVHTNRSSDMVYISENSTATHLDTLSNIIINLQVFVGECSCY